MSLTGAVSHWLRKEPSGSITNWETLKMKFLNKYCPPARTTKKMEEEVILFYKYTSFSTDLPSMETLHLTNLQIVNASGLLTWKLFLLDIRGCPQTTHCLLNGESLHVISDAFEVNTLFSNYSSLMKVPVKGSRELVDNDKKAKDSPFPFIFLLL
ncbi:hypothetical protein Tco_0608793 [Tanacetum coccineum]